MTTSPSATRTRAGESPHRARSTSSRKGLGRTSRDAECGSRSPQGAAAEQPRHEAFESGNARDAYSSVSHLKENLDSLSFAIGLREGKGQEGALERLLPMLKIQPRPNEADRKGDKGREKSYMECDHPDCIAREDKIKKLQEMIVDETEGLERLTSEIESLNDRRSRAVTETETLDDRIDEAMARRVEIDAQNQELQLVVDEADARKHQLQEEAGAVRKEVADLTTLLETRDKERREQEIARAILESVRVVFRRRTMPQEATSEEARSVRALPDSLH